MRAKEPIEHGIFPSVRQLCICLGLSQNTFNNLEAQGIVTREPSRKLDSAKIHAQILEYNRQLLEEYPATSSKRGGSGTETESLIEEEKLKQARLKTESMQIENRIRSGELVEADSVRIAFRKLAEVMREPLNNLPGRVALQLEGRTRAQIESHLRDELGEIMRGVDAQAATITITTAAFAAEESGDDDE